MTPASNPRLRRAQGAWALGALGTCRARELRQARTDALTGLGNRRMLLRDAELAIAAATAERPVGLTILDLDGFKSYNDGYGHPAGDALLGRLGTKLTRAVAPWGTAYRLSGDEFCTLVYGDQLAQRQAIAAAAGALTEEGEAFTVGSSHGTVLVPEEAGDVAEALRRADRRLYGARRPGAPAREAGGVLRPILLERAPELGDHQEAVGRTASPASSAHTNA